MNIIKKLTASALVVLGLSTSGALAAGAYDTHIEDFDFSFEGPFGSYDVNQLQRGLQIYTEICSACHGLKFVPIRTLGDEGGPGLPGLASALGAALEAASSRTASHRSFICPRPCPTLGESVARNRCRPLGR